MLTEKEKEFFIGLEKLTKATGVAVGGCGCCNSPYFYFPEPDSLQESYYVNDDGSIAWVDVSDETDVDIYGELEAPGKEMLNAN